MQRNSYADVTSYGQGYDRRDVISKTEIRKFKYYNCPRCSCGQCTRKRLRRAHAVNYRRHERWWATPVVKSSKLVVSCMKLTKRVAGFVVFLIRPWSSPGLSRLGHRKDTLQCFFGTSDPLRLQTGHRLFCRCWTRDLHPSRVSPNYQITFSACRAQYPIESGARVGYFPVHTAFPVS